MDNAITPARALNLLKSYRDEIEALIKTASEKVHDHAPLVTDTGLLDETKKLLQKLERVEPEPEESRKNTQEKEVTDHPGIQELRLYVRKAIGSENHNGYIAAMQCAQLSAEHYIAELK
jgi:hypothetical protein